MRVISLPAFVFTVALRCLVEANVEKTIFLSPRAVTLPNAHALPGLDDLHPDKSILETRLSVQFPTASAPRGLESWYLLRGLREGQRYEVRLCWPATSPTDFWLDTFPVAQVLETPELLSSLAAFSKARQDPDAEEAPSAESMLLLRVQAAASYYSLNRTLMEYPPLVDADIILDPFLLNILPRSLAPTAAYITVVAGASWFISAFVYRYLLSIAAGPLSTPPLKPHTD